MAMAFDTALAFSVDLSMGTSTSNQAGTRPSSSIFARASAMGFIFLYLDDRVGSS